MTSVTPPSEIAAWLACFAFVLMLVNSGFKFFRYVRGKDPEPPNSSLALALTQLATRVDKLETAYAHTSTELHNMHTELLKAGEDRSSKIHARMNPLIENTAAIKGYLEAMSRRSFGNIPAES